MKYLVFYWFFLRYSKINANFFYLFISQTCFNSSKYNYNNSICISYNSSSNNKVALSKQLLCQKQSSEGFIGFDVWTENKIIWKSSLFFNFSTKWSTINYVCMFIPLSDCIYLYYSQLFMKNSLIFIGKDKAFLIIIS